MTDAQWLHDYFERYRRSIFDPGVHGLLRQLRDRLRAVRDAGRKVVIAGNGGSAALASHCAVDLTKVAGVRALTFNDADLITCFANDFGYERWVARALEAYADAGDLVILVSSSGRSPNIVAAAACARERGLDLVTFSGFDADNPLRAAGGLSFWVDSRAYNIVEMTHHIWLLAACDLLTGAAEYPAA